MTGKQVLAGDAIQPSGVWYCTMEPGWLWGMPHLVQQVVSVLSRWIPMAFMGVQPMGRAKPFLFICITMVVLLRILPAPIFLHGLVGSD